MDTASLRLRLISLGVAVCFLCAMVWAEDLTISTYYPTPSGSFYDLDVKHDLRVGHDLTVANDATINHNLYLDNDFYMRSGRHIWIRGSDGIDRIAVTLNDKSLDFLLPVSFPGIMLAGHNLHGALDAAQAYDFWLRDWIGWLQMQLATVWLVASAVAAIFAPAAAALIILGIGAVTQIPGAMAAFGGIQPPPWWP